MTVDELGHNKITADVYHSVAPTLHWNYYAKVGREHTFAEVREADLTSMAGAAGGLIMKYESKSLLVREPVGVVAALPRSTSRCRASPRRSRRRSSPAARPWSRPRTRTR